VSESRSIQSRLDASLGSRLAAPRWWVAFSGGPDSTVLLHLIQQWCAANPQQTPPLHALHIDHGLQAQAVDWRAHCVAICERWGIPLQVSEAWVAVDGRGMEAAAREARYGAFRAQISVGDVLFMGHHLDDQVETYFLRLLRGAGMQGLSAMPASRPLGEGELCRPLLDIERQQLQEYAAAHQLTSVVDPSNSDTDIDRNYLRETVLPLLAQRWTGYRQTVARAADHAASSVALTDEYLPQAKTMRSELGDPGLTIKALNLGRSHSAMLILRRWLRAGGYAMPDQSLLVEFLRQLREGGENASPRMDCGEYALERYQSQVYLLPEFARQNTSLGEAGVVTVNLTQPSEIVGVGEVSFAEVSDGAGLRLNPDDVLELRWRRGGERCRPVGKPYQQRLKKLFQERGVPPWWRERVPLLYLDNELLAVGDLWLCESSRLASETTGEGRLWQLCWERKAAAFD
jgi:tRNA(Ile)-lysidine synthase